MTAEGLFLHLSGLLD